MSFSPYIDKFPVDLRGDKEWISFGEFLDNFDNQAIQAITEMKYFWDLERAPEYILPFLGYSVGAQIDRGDSDRLKRQKIRDAVKENQRKGTGHSARKWIKQVTGVAPTFSSGSGKIADNGHFMIWESSLNLLPFPNDFFKWESLNNVDAGGAGWGEQKSSGVQERYIVRVDLRLDDLSSVIVDRVEKVVKYFGAAYIRYLLGYNKKGWHLYRTIH